MTQEQFYNFAYTTLGSLIPSDPIGAGTTVAITLNAPSPGNLFPTSLSAGQVTRINIEGEIMTVTAISGSSYTVIRGSELSAGTSVPSHPAGSVVNQYLTAGALLQFAQLGANNQTFTGAPFFYNLPQSSFASQNYGRINLGSAGFSGGGGTNFVGMDANGTEIAINSASSLGAFTDYQVNGVSKWRIDKSGNLTTAGTLPASKLTGAIPGTVTFPSSVAQVGSANAFTNTNSYASTTTFSGIVYDNSTFEGQSALVMPVDPGNTVTGLSGLTTGGLMASGTYYYVLTYTHANGETTNGPLSGGVTIGGSVNSGSVTLTIPSVPAVTPTPTGQNLYRTKSTSQSGPFYFVASFGTTTQSYTDIKSDAQLGAVTPSVMMANSQIQTSGPMYFNGPITPNANAGYISLGTGGWGGVAGHFSGHAQGTVIAFNGNSYAGSYLDFQNGATRNFHVSAYPAGTEPGNIFFNATSLPSNGYLMDLQVGGVHKFTLTAASGAGLGAISNATIAASNVTAGTFGSAAILPPGQLGTGAISTTATVTNTNIIGGTSGYLLTSNGVGSSSWANTIPGTFISGSVANATNSAQLGSVVAANYAQLSTVNTFTSPNSFSGGSISLTNATSNLLSFTGGTVLGAPGAASVGERIQLLGATQGTVAATDYGIGVETNNMWFNVASSSGFKWYVNSALVANIDTAGAFNTVNGINAGSTLQLPMGTTTMVPLLFNDGPVLTSPVAGGVEYDGTKYSLTTDGANRRTVMTAIAGVTSTTANIFGTTDTVVGFIPITGTEWYAGRQIIFRVFGRATTSASSPTITIRLRAGNSNTGTQLYTSGTSSAPLSQTAVAFMATAILTCRTTGTSGTVWGNGEINVGGTGLSTTAPSAAVTLNTTTTTGISFTIGTSGSATNVTVDQLQAYLI